MSHEIQKMLVLSTVHLTDDTLRKLAEDAASILAYPNEFGAFVVADLGMSGMELDLLTCVELAQSLGCAWIKFDRDARPTLQLPLYD